MVFGIFVLIAGLASLFFMFNAGQLIHDKDKLVNAADAVAYSGGVMHARALNYAAYSNRALLANEMAVAQVVSLSSWVRFMDQHAFNAATAFNCRTWWSVPATQTMARYALLCATLAYAQPSIAQVDNAFEMAAPALIARVEVAKAALQLAQDNMMIRMLPARSQVMREVAQANFRNDGDVEVNELVDGFTLFDGAPVLQRRNGNERARFADAARRSAAADGFMNSRRWREQSLIPSCVGLNGIFNNRVDRAGGTSLIGLDEWKSIDSASLYTYRFNGKTLRCQLRPERVIAGGVNAAYRTNDVESNDTNAFGRSRAINPRASRFASSSDAWQAYTGVPAFLSLSDRALAYVPDHANPDRREVKIQLSVRLIRRPTEIRNSEGRSLVRSSPAAAQGINNYRGAPLKGVYAAVATSEVFFERPLARTDGRTELANAFNPYWQVRLVRSDQAIAAAAALQLN